VLTVGRRQAQARLGRFGDLALVLLGLAPGGRLGLGLLTGFVLEASLLGELGLDPLACVLLDLATQRRLLLAFSRAAAFARSFASSWRSCSAFCSAAFCSPVTTGIEGLVAK
jgi:hypothetical protein